MGQEIRKGTGEKKRKGRGHQAAWTILALILMQGCFLKHQDLGLSEVNYKDLYLECKKTHEESLQLIVKCEKDLTECREVARDLIECP